MVEEDNETTDHQYRTRPPGSTRATRQPGITCVKIIKGIITGLSLNFASVKHDSCLYQGTIDGHDGKDSRDIIQTSELHK